MSELYSRVGSASLIKETVANTPLTPTTYFELLSESLSVDYAYTPSMPIVNNRTKNIRAVCKQVPAPNGAIVVNVEPKKFGHFLNGLFGGVTSGRYFPISGVTGTFTVGETVTGGTSAATATVLAVSKEKDYLIMGAPTGTFTAAGESITGGSSGATATLGVNAATVYGHHGILPDSSIPTYSLQINYDLTAVRYFGVRFSGMTLNQQDNIITAEMQCIAIGQFRHGYVTAVTSSGAGSKTITVDQTLGLVASDSIKVFRPSTGTFLDFSAASVKTHTINAVTNSTSFTITNLETSLAVGDLIVLAPQTPSYTVGNEFCWIGGSEWRFGDDLDTLATETAEDFSIVITNEFEERHGADGADFEDIFPTALLQKGVEASGQFTKYYEDEKKYSKFRKNTMQAIRFDSIGDLIGSTNVRNLLRFAFPSVQFDQYNTNLTTEDIVNEEIPFTAFYNSTKTNVAKALLVNDQTAY